MTTQKKKVKLDQVIKDLEGEDRMETIDKRINGKIIPVEQKFTLRRALIAATTNPLKCDVDSTAEEKMITASLAHRIYEVKEEIAFTENEIEILKKRVNLSFYNPLIVNDVIKMITK